jgi:hypothetical protein
MLRKAKVGVGKDTLGAPELLEWALEQNKVEILPQFREDLEQAIYSLDQWKPQTVVKLLAEPEPGEVYQVVKEIQKLKSPVQVAELLLNHLHQVLGIRVEGYNPGTPKGMDHLIR